MPGLIRVRSSQFITDMTTELMTHFNLSMGDRYLMLSITSPIVFSSFIVGITTLRVSFSNFLDEERRNDLKEIITYSLRDEGIIPQLIVITHHSELNSAAYISYTVESKNGISRIIPT